MYSITVEIPNIEGGAMYLTLKKEEAEMLVHAFNAFSQIHGTPPFLTSIQQQEITDAEA